MVATLCQAEQPLLVSSSHGRLRLVDRNHPGEYVRAVFRYRYGVFHMSTGLPIQRDDRPTVGQDFGEMTTQIHHRFNRKYVTCLDLRALSGAAIIRDLRILVHPAPDAVADIVSHN